MNLIKLVGASAIILGLAACGQADKKTDVEKAESAISDTMSSTKEAATKAVDEVGEGAGELVEDAKDAGAEMADDATELGQKIKKKTEETMKDAESAIEDLKE
jgi:hypothetical protein